MIFLYFLILTLLYLYIKTQPLLLLIYFLLRIYSFIFNILENVSVILNKP